METVMDNFHTSQIFIHFLVFSLVTKALIKK